jgi:4-azaleucine resistance transporter AzlC
MKIPTDMHAGPPRGSRAGFMLGVRLALPVVPAMVAFGLAVGATAARQGLSFLDNALMNLTMYAGMSQLVAMEIWPERFTPVAIVTLVVITATINARMLLITASLYPWLGPLPAWKIYPVLHLVVEPGWLIAMRYRAQGGSDTGVFFGASVMLAIAWIGASVTGHLIGALISDPRRFGIDLVMPVFFTAMLIPLWRGPRRGLAWLIAGVVALAVRELVGGWWFIVAGSLAGSIAGGFID